MVEARGLIFKIFYGTLTIMSKLSSIYDRCLIYTAIFRYDSLAKL